MSGSVGLGLDRCFRIMELFREKQTPLSASDIQSALACPKSSLNLILRGMCDLEYLHRDPRTRTYFPSVQFQKLGDWILPTITRGPRLQALAAELRNQIEETVLVTVKGDNCMEVAVVETSAKPIALQVPVGTRFDIFGTAVGVAYLMNQKDRDIERLYDHARRANGLDLTLDDVGKHVTTARNVGYAIAFGSVVPELAALAVPLKLETGHQPLVLSVGGPIERIKANWARLSTHLRRAANHASIFVK